ncbi:SAM-dependent methyltransferase [Cryobacterium roopkundense]|uniref:SAM-dependent methyltransferase n=1 Tax=Cryobacterium roopkundense TaxID=1001240 RepID=A0A099JBP4_9MICO|nr:class I SAM-dependent methyltransferase [Cryobacterium roopkundense]KGJ75681.1 SAM-dependent methyltransferase [Cryobacterium roopkundense]MBB5641131.1 SAM-dependent methyltransferase [Cryobacterium roopkundense]
MTGNVVREAYADRAEEYTALLGSMANTHESDQRLVAKWASDLRGRVIDAGCGPGHWTEFLRELGVEAEGVDQVQEFIGRAKARFPAVPFRTGSLGDLDVPDGYAAAVLAWYSLIHLAPDELAPVLCEFARCIAPGGSLLIAFFEGDSVVPFSHAVTTAYFWPVGEMSVQLKTAGFVVYEVHTRTDPGKRPHAAIIAHRSDMSIASPGLD